MKKETITSVKDPDTAYPWYDVDVNADGEPEILDDKDGEISTDLTGATASVPSFVDLPNPAQKSMSKDTRYAVTKSGDFIAFEPSDDLAAHGVSLRAHLAWYDSEADEFTVLDIVEG